MGRSRYATVPVAIFTNRSYWSGCRVVATGKEAVPTTGFECSTPFYTPLSSSFCLSTPLPIHTSPAHLIVSLRPALLPQLSGFGPPAETSLASLANPHGERESQRGCHVVAKVTVICARSVCGLITLSTSKELRSICNWS